MEWMFGAIIAAIIGAGVGIFATTAQNDSIRQTNSTNKQIADDANKLSQQESAKALYQSLPTTQVRNMVAAGMSKYGALSVLDNGGVYTPAPITTSQMQPKDFSGMSELGSNFFGLGSQMSTTQMQLQAQERMNAQNNQTQLDIAKMQLSQDIDKFNVQNYSSRVIQGDRDNFNKVWSDIERIFSESDRPSGLSYNDVIKSLSPTARNLYDKLHVESKNEMLQAVNSYRDSSFVGKTNVQSEDLNELTKIGQYLDNVDTYFSSVLKSSEVALNSAQIKLTKKQRVLCEKNIKLAQQSLDFNEDFNAERLNQIREDIKLRKENIKSEQFKRDIDAIRSQLDVLDEMARFRGFKFLGGEVGFEGLVDYNDYKSLLNDIVDSYDKINK